VRFVVPTGAGGLEDASHLASVTHASGAHRCLRAFIDLRPNLRDPTYRRETLNCSDCLFRSVNKQHGTFQGSIKGKHG
jgi:hypothetical protein